MALCNIVTNGDLYFLHKFQNPDLALVRMMQAEQSMRNDGSGDSSNPAEVAKAVVTAVRRQAKNQRKKPLSAATVEDDDNADSGLVVRDAMNDERMALDNARILTALFDFKFKERLVANKKVSDHVFAGTLSLYSPGETIEITEDHLKRLNRPIPLKAGEEEAWSSEYSEDDESDDTPLASQIVAKKKAAAAKGKVKETGLQNKGKGKETVSQASGSSRRRGFWSDDE